MGGAGHAGRAGQTAAEGQTPANPPGAGGGAEGEGKGAGAAGDCSAASADRDKAAEAGREGKGSQAMPVTGVGAKVSRALWAAVVAAALSAGCAATSWQMLNKN